MVLVAKLTCREVGRSSRPPSVSAPQSRKGLITLSRAAPLSRVSQKGCQIPSLIRVALGVGYGFWKTGFTRFLEPYYSKNRFWWPKSAGLRFENTKTAHFLPYLPYSEIRISLNPLFVTSLFPIPIPPHALLSWGRLLVCKCKTQEIMEVNQAKYFGIKATRICMEYVEREWNQCPLWYCNCKENFEGLNFLAF